MLNFIVGACIKWLEKALWSFPGLCGPFWQSMHQRCALVAIVCLWPLSTIGWCSCSFSWCCLPRSTSRKKVNKQPLTRATPGKPPTQPLKRLLAPKPIILLRGRPTLHSTCGLRIQIPPQHTMAAGPTLVYCPFCSTALNRFHCVLPNQRSKKFMVWMWNSVFSQISHPGHSKIHYYDSHIQPIYFKGLFPRTPSVDGSQHGCAPF